MFSPTGQTENKKQFGDLGFDPTSLMTQEMTTKPQIDDDLRMGTTQMTEHIPGYTGYLPAARTRGKAFEQGKGRNTRNTEDKTNLLENL